jgi:hypothetical protein
MKPPRLRRRPGTPNPLRSQVYLNWQKCQARSACPSLGSAWRREFTRHVRRNRGKLASAARWLAQTHSSPSRVASPRNQRIPRKTTSTATPTSQWAFCFGAPGRAHLPGGESPLLTRQGEELAERQAETTTQLMEQVVERGSDARCGADCGATQNVRTPGQRH